MNTFGTKFRLTSFGESHGAAVGGVIDGMQPGIPVDLEYVQAELDRRRPGQSAITTSRKEPDKVEILSGVFDGVTTGTPIGFIVRNTNQHSSDYDNLRQVFRPSHADFTYFTKYGVRDHRGGGRSSARETISRVVAGAFAKIALSKMGISVTAYTSQVGDIKVTKPYSMLDLSAIESNAVRCPDLSVAERMEALIKDVQRDGDTIGGVVSCVIQGAPAGIGNPVFGKLQSALASAMLSINAAKGFDYGLGFDDCGRRGSEMIDTFVPADSSINRIHTLSNHSGGIQGGISNGEDIYFRVAFKPVATLLMDVDTVDVNGNPVVVKARGRHDPCVLPRAVPIVEAMAAIALYDMILS